MRTTPYLHRIVLLITLALSAITSSYASNQGDDTFVKTLPLADLHMHLFGKRPIFYQELMDRNGVKWGGGVGGSVFDDDEAVSTLLGTRHIRTLGQKEFAKVFFQKGAEGLSDLQQSDFVSLFAQAEQEFQSGKAFGFGEIHGNNRRSHGPRNERFARKISLKSPVIQKMFEMADRHKKFIQLHLEGDEDTLAELRDQLTSFPSAKVILSHCLPYSSAQTVQRLFDQHANLYCEISAGGPVHKVARIFNDAGISPRFEPIILQYADRFLLGTDPCCGLDHLYDDMILELRNYFLARLPRDVAEKIAYKNAQRLLDLK